MTKPTSFVNIMTDESMKDNKHKASTGSVKQKSAPYISEIFQKRAVSSLKLIRIKRWAERVLLAKLYE